jgi:hypothetical protein
MTLVGLEYEQTYGKSRDLTLKPMMNTQTAILRERPKVKTIRQNSAKIPIQSKSLQSKSTQKVTRKQRTNVSDKPRKSGNLLGFLFLTSIVFGFGGLGFGLGVRFAEDFSIFSNSPDSSVLQFRE